MSAVSPVLPAGFKITRRDGEYIISCTVCGTTWAVPAIGGELSPRVIGETDRHTSAYCADLRTVNGR